MQPNGDYVNHLPLATLNQKNRFVFDGPETFLRCSPDTELVIYADQDVVFTGGLLGSD